MAKTYSTPTQLPLPIDGATIEIKLTKGYIAIVDAIDADLAEFKWTTAGKEPHIYGYRHIQVNGKIKTILMHVVILERTLSRSLINGEYPDHKNHIGTDNTRNNLRLSTKMTNAQNMVVKSNNKLGLKGVYKHNRGDFYVAEIKVNKKKISLGCFKSPVHAACAYNAAAIKYFGEFAFLNDIPNWEAIAEADTIPQGMSRRNTSGYKGVTRHQNKWRAYINVNGEVIQLGRFHTREEANEARLKFIEREGL